MTRRILLIVAALLTTGIAVATTLGGGLSPGTLTPSLPGLLDASPDAQPLGAKAELGAVAGHRWTLVPHAEGDIGGTLTAMGGLDVVKHLVPAPSSLVKNMNDMKADGGVTYDERKGSQLAPVIDGKAVTQKFAALGVAPIVASEVTPVMKKLGMTVPFGFEQKMGQLYVLRENAEMFAVVQVVDGKVRAVAVTRIKVETSGDKVDVNSPVPTTDPNLYVSAVLSTK